MTEKKERLATITSYTLEPRHTRAVRDAATRATIEEGRFISASEIMRRILDTHFGERLAAY